MDIQKHNAHVNEYRREAEKLGIGSPYRVKEYIDARLNGKTEKAALRAASQ